MSFLCLLLSEKLSLETFPSILEFICKYCIKLHSDTYLFKTVRYVTVFKIKLASSQRDSPGVKPDYDLQIGAYCAVSIDMRNRK